MNKKNSKNEQTEQRTIDDLTLIELKALAYDLLAQKQMIETSLAQVNGKLIEKTQAVEASA